MEFELENQQQRSEEEIEKIVNEEYKVWKKNSPFLYDLVITHALEWPSLTCQWFPTVENVPDKNYKVQELLLGTHTNDDEPNYLQIASVKLPTFDNTTDDTSMEDVNVDENDTFIKITQKILHDGEVNRARYQPGNPNIIATKSRIGDVYLFDRTTFDARPKDNETFNPTMRLIGHDKEGYGLAWNPHKQKGSHLISAGFDSKICQWDINGTTRENHELEPVRTYRAHNAGVEDVAWHTKFENIFASVGDDTRLMIWDVRNNSTKPTHNIQAHEAEVNCVAFAPGSEWILATGSSDKNAELWDLRNFKLPIHTFRAHQSEILQLAWSPHHDAVLATASSDRRILIWDLSRIGASQSAEDAEDGPPELLFMHGGHTNKISDFDWNPVDPWVLGSTADDNIVQVWQPASHICSPSHQSEASQEKMSASEGQPQQTKSVEKQTEKDEDTEMTSANQNVKTTPLYLPQQQSTTAAVAATIAMSQAIAAGTTTSSNTITSTNDNNEPSDDNRVTNNDLLSNSNTTMANSMVSPKSQVADEDVTMGS
ncbi:WD40-repeat-containing domain protein [Mycotypha africana]|uniref:WD40-repeat-containing domain protein n=1 Tax=Mycotypha africana TaxID=64632 RepID=UPI0023015F79|nr:WD40-repeat-containing domain protein [Mycotypha africana]KAI8979827.1 WD40-repeat-containing domain protein [Mycotypha africana]